MSFVKKHRTAVIVVLCILAEIIIANFSSLNMLLGGYKEKTLDLSSAAIENHESTEFKNDTIIISEGMIEFSDINIPVANICIASNSSDGQYKKIGLSFTDDNFAYEDGFDYNSGTFYIYEEQNNKSYLDYSSFGSVKTLRLNVSDDNAGTLAITSVAVNRLRPFHVNILRLICLLAAALVVRFGIWKLSVSDTKNGYRILAAAGAAVCVITCLCTIVLTKAPDSRLLSKYDPEDMYSHDQYEELFYALTQGKTSIDVDFDTSEFDKLDNIYDRSERNEQKLHGSFWDRAYYNGKFYCYFGIAPIITVYYPIYFLTRSVPTPILASMTAAVYAEIFITLLYITVIRKMCRDVPLALAVLGLVAVIFGSLVLPLAFEFKFYYLAVLSGVGFVAAFLYFLLKAYYEKKDRRRIIYLILTGLAAAGIAASRPTLLLYCVIAAVPAIFIFTDKKIKARSKVCYSAAIIAPVILGAIGLMYYNYIRFESPFEFGFNYQVTVSIAKANTMTVGMIPPMIYHFFFQQPDFSTHFPYLHMRSRELELYPRYNYNGRLIGILNYPLIPTVSLIPFTSRKKDKFRAAFIISLSAICLVLAFVDMCKAGSHYRYTADILMPLLIVGIVVIFDILGRVGSISKRAYRYAYAFTAAILFLTFMVGFLMMFCNESANLMKDYAFMSRIFYHG